MVTGRFCFPLHYFRAVPLMILSTLWVHMAVAPTGFFAMMPAGRGAATMPPLLFAVMPTWRCVAAFPILLLAVVDARGGA